MKLEQYVGYTENKFGENNLTGSTAIAQENILGRLHLHDSIFTWLNIFLKFQRQLITKYLIRMSDKSLMEQFQGSG